VLRTEKRKMERLRKATKTQVLLSARVCRMRVYCQTYLRPWRGSKKHRKEVRVWPLGLQREKLRVVRSVRLQKKRRELSSRRVLWCQNHRTPVLASPRASHRN